MSDAPDRTAGAGWRAGAGESDARVLVVDNYDSFAYNLVQYVGEVAGAVAVRRNDAVDVDGIRDLDPDGVVVSPGPGTPAEAGVSIDAFQLERPVFGVCLGHQALCASGGGRVGHAPEVVHGKPSTITHDGAGVFSGLPDRLRVGRYHSLCVEREDLPDELVETARTEDEREVVMGVRHREKPHVGVQFHPESILTPRGKALVRNFVEVCEDREESRDALRYHVDGEVVPASEATVSVEDRGFAYGDAAFETLRAYGGEVFRWDDHAARLADTCETLGLDHGLADADLKSRIDETLAANELADAYVKLSITRGVQPGTLDPQPAVDPTVVVIAKPLPRGGVDSDPVHDGAAALQTTKTRKPSSRALPADAKTHNYLNGILARLELRVTGADEALMLDPDGNVAEGATSNLFFADGTALKTPSLDGPILPGVTRRTVIEIAEEEGIPVEEGTYTPDAVREADEAFLTNSTWEIRPVETVDGLAVDGDGDGVEGPLTALLSRLFDRRVEERHYDGERR